MTIEEIKSPEDVVKLIIALDEKIKFLENRTNLIGDTLAYQNKVLDTHTTRLDLHSKTFYDFDQKISDL